jgi:hypothetical protein
MHAFVHKNVYAYVCMYASVYACMRGTMYDSPHDILYHLYAYTNTFALEKCSPQFFFTFWSWQMQALDLKTSLAEAKRDKAMDNVTISSLQQVTRS